MQQRSGVPVEQGPVTTMPPIDGDAVDEQRDVDAEARPPVARRYGRDVRVDRVVRDHPRRDHGEDDGDAADAEDLAERTGGPRPRLPGQRPARRRRISASTTTPSRLSPPNDQRQSKVVAEPRSRAGCRSAKPTRRARRHDREREAGAVGRADPAAVGREHAPDRPRERAGDEPRDQRDARRRRESAVRVFASTSPAIAATSSGLRRSPRVRVIAGTVAMHGAEGVGADEQADRALARAEPVGDRGQEAGGHRLHRDEEEPDRREHDEREQGRRVGDAGPAGGAVAVGTGGGGHRRRSFQGAGGRCRRRDEQRGGAPRYGRARSAERPRGHPSSGSLGVDRRRGRHRPASPRHGRRTPMDQPHQVGGGRNDVRRLRPQARRAHRRRPLRRRLEPARALGPRPEPRHGRRADRRRTTPTSCASTSVAPSRTASARTSSSRPSPT